MPNLPRTPILLRPLHHRPYHTIPPIHSTPCLWIINETTSILLPRYPRHSKAQAYTAPKPQPQPQPQHRALYQKTDPSPSIIPPCWSRKDKHPPPPLPPLDAKNRPLLPSILPSLPIPPPNPNPNINAKFDSKQKSHRRNPEPLDKYTIFLCAVIGASGPVIGILMVKLVEVGNEEKGKGERNVFVGEEEVRVRLRAFSGS